MPPLDFSQDGAFGAGGGASPSSSSPTYTGNGDYNPADLTWNAAEGGFDNSGALPQGTGSLGNNSNQNPGFNGPVDGYGSWSGQAAGDPLTGGGYAYPGGSLDPGQSSAGANGTVYGNKSNTNNSVGANGQKLTSGSWDPSTDAYVNRGTSSGDAPQYGGPGGLSFAQGGAVPTEDETDDTNGSPAQDATHNAIQKALDSVDQILAYGRQANGLGGGQDDGGAIPGAGQQVAQASYQNGRMPAVPGSQSNSGVPPVQPMPGPLPPTSNPFGKRTSDNSDQSGAIDTEEAA